MYNSEEIRKLLCDNKEDRDYTKRIFEEIEKEFQGSSDRGVAVIAASIIDNLIEGLIQVVLVPFNSNTDRKNIFSSNGPLSNLSNKIEMAFSLGLLSDFDKALLKTIVSIRNKLAHQISGIDFEKKEIVELCKKLVMPDELLISINIEHKKDGKLIIYKPRKDDYKGWFKTATYVAISIISSRQIQFCKWVNSTPNDFKHRKDFITTSIDTVNHFINETNDVISNKEKYKLTENQLVKFNENLKVYEQQLEFYEQQKEDALNVKIIER